LATLPDFDSIKVVLAGPEEILGWSYGEVLKPETINYRTQKPEKDGLFCERIFGPVKNWECSCGKYKRIRYKGLICDKCGVEVTRSIVRRERMGHIRLACPVAHVWYSRSVPNYMALMLGISPRNLERVLYFAQYIVTFVDEQKRKEALKDMDAKQDEVVAKLREDLDDKIKFLQEQQDVQNREFMAKHKKSDPKTLQGYEDSAQRALEHEIQKLRDEFNNAVLVEQEEFKTLATGIERLETFQNISEKTYRKYREYFPEVFKAEMGAEAITKIIKMLDLDALTKELWQDVKKSGGQRRKKNLKRLEIIQGMAENKIDPANMILGVLPVLPADLRPMVQLSGGRFAASDLNDLYRRVINRNNRLKKLIKLNAPEVIVRNEKRMLQEAVDALIDNSNKNRKVVMAMGKKKQKLKSLSDILRGKQGRFRQNLLGKRVDYSGRAVIVIGPDLKLNQCGLPRHMAIELFKPFILRDLIKRGYATTLKSANLLIEKATPEVLDVLEQVVVNYPVLLNRAPTLHRLGIQSFFPVLVDGNAIRLHPLVCSAFNADFDGDQMAVYIPLSKAALDEARQLMMADKNLLIPASGNPSVGPTLDIVLGLYYLTMMVDVKQPQVFANVEQALQYYNLDEVDLRHKIIVYMEDGKPLETTIGRIIFNKEIPKELGYYNDVMNKKKLGRVISLSFQQLGVKVTADLVDKFKDLGFRYATRSGITMAIDDVQVPEKKLSILADGDKKAGEIERQYHRGLITEEERYEHTVNLWTTVTGDVTKTMLENMDRTSDIFVIMDSGARGSVEQMRQLAGMRGLMADPSGKIMDLPIKANFREGLSVLEYFISTHGARKGRSDTALRTADSGYLTRRLVDVAQSLVTIVDDCGDTEGRLISWKRDETGRILGTVLRQDIMGRILLGDVIDPKTKKAVAKIGDTIDEKVLADIEQSGAIQAHVRSILSCKTKRGVCCACYGWDLGTGKLTQKAEAIGIVAAQSIGEPGTQLTMRNFHTGGVAGLDITQGLPRVEELFEARTPKGEAPISEVPGKVHIETTDEDKVITVANDEEGDDIYELDRGFSSTVKKGETVVKEGAVVAINKETEEKVLALTPGIVKSVDEAKIVVHYKHVRVRDYHVPHNARLYVKEGDIIEAGQQLIEGSVDPHNILRVKGERAGQNYLIEQIQEIYLSQGVVTHTKHIEVIVKQMFGKVRVEKPGDTHLIPKEFIDKDTFDEINEKIIANGGEIAKASKIILGITKASLASDSFLSAASFQETIKVLSKAALRGEVDYLHGLKENLIIGKLIPVGPYGRSEYAKGELTAAAELAVESESPRQFAEEDLVKS